MLKLGVFLAVFFGWMGCGGPNENGFHALSMTSPRDSVIKLPAWLIGTWKLSRYTMTFGETTQEFSGGQPLHPVASSLVFSQGQSVYEYSALGQVPNGKNTVTMVEGVPHLLLWPTRTLNQEAMVSQTEGGIAVEWDFAYPVKIKAFYSIDSGETIELPAWLIGSWKPSRYVVKRGDETEEISVSDFLRFGAAATLVFKPGNSSFEYSAYASPGGPVIHGQNLVSMSDGIPSVLLWLPLGQYVSSATISKTTDGIVVEFEDPHAKRFIYYVQGR